MTNPRLVIGLVIAVLVALGVGGYFLFQLAEDDDSTVEPTVTPTATRTQVATATKTLLPPTSTSTLEPTANPVPTTPTPDLRVPSMELPTLEQIQVGADGKYFIEARADGCRWDEALRLSDPDVGETVLLRTDCRADFQFEFRPAGGQVFVNIS